MDVQTAVGNITVFLEVETADLSMEDQLSVLNQISEDTRARAEHIREVMEDQH